MKIKLFCEPAMDYFALEEDVNNFLSDPEIVVEDIQMQIVSGEIGIMVVYREKTKHIDADREDGSISW